MSTTTKFINDKQVFVEVLEFITNNFYKTDHDINIVLSPDNKELNYYDGYKIVLAEGLIDAYGALNLPRFVVYYHELGHHLYSQNLFHMCDAWARIKQGKLKYYEKYQHLLNWIEDFYIEDMLKKEHSYLTDVLSCLKKIEVDYDITKIEYAFNYWYINEAPTPALTYTDQISFKAYLMNLLKLRSSKGALFGRGILSDLSIKQSTETQFILLLIEFYNWCVSKKIFPKHTQPPLNNPNNHLEPIKDLAGTNTTDATTTVSSEELSEFNQAGDDPTLNKILDDTKSNKGSSSDHSKTVGQTGITYQETAPIKTGTTLFKEELAQEKILLDRQRLDMSERIQTEKETLDGLFSTKYKDSSIIQNKVIIPNFFNPNRLIDQILFREKQHAYMNVAFYRDISGSVSYEQHRFMDKVINKLHEVIPVDITYYLYASGDISIIEVPYIPWPSKTSPPKEYLDNKLYKQLGVGTNSDAIADVITQQLSDKWLNIILTDGDLNRLLARDNIKELLKNVFVIAFECDVPQELKGIRIDGDIDIQKIINNLSSINLAV